MTEPQRVALLCSGLDETLGGFESHMRSLFLLGRRDFPDLDIVMFTGRGPETEGVVRAPTPSRSHPVARRLARYRKDRLFWESLFFALWFLVRAIFKQDRFDRIMTIEPTVRRVLFPFVRYLPGAPELVWTHGLNNEPSGYLHDADVVHEVNVENFERATSIENRSAQIALIPHFVDDSQSPSLLKEEARNRLGIKTKYALLGVGRIDATVKRSQHLVAEVAKLSDDWTLVLVGSVGEPRIVEDAVAALDHKFVHVQVDAQDMPDVYVAADVFAHAAINEGFGIVFLEAMHAGLPIVAHDRRSFDWILGESARLVDMTISGTLANAVIQLEKEGNLASFKEVGSRRIATMFGWSALAGDYHKLLSGELVEHCAVATARRPSSLVALRSRRRRAHPSRRLDSRD
ncbi:MAG: glycosyltransferase family 4 protein [Acidimicrobiia bacterium]|nr:glycosyltransferase family 4 protein [Acidimicrobiia bacterium]